METTKEEGNVMGKVSREEKELLKRVKECKYPTDRLGPGSLLTMQSHISSSREILANNHMAQMVSIKDPESPLVPTGFEKPLSKYSHMTDTVEGNYRIVKKFQKNPYNYVLIGFDEERRVYHAWRRIEMEEHSEGFTTRYNNDYMDSLEVGDVVEDGTKIQQSTNFDKYGNYLFGRNVNLVYLADPIVYEDGILVMNGAEKKFITYRAHTVEINLADNEFFVNLYGSKNHPQGFPLVGERVKEGIVAAIRRADNATAQFSLKKSKLMRAIRSDRKYYVSGRVVDIDVHTNKDPKKLSTVAANGIITQLYTEQQEYYMNLYQYTIGIVDRASDEGYSYTDEFSGICSEAYGHVNSAAFYAGAVDNVYGNTRIIIRLLEEEDLLVGSKMVGRCGNKGVVAKILPPEESWHMEDGTPVELVVPSLGIFGRMNHAQLNEHSTTELGATAVAAMKQTDDVETKAAIVHRLLEHLNPKEAKKFKSWFKKLSQKEKEKCCRRIEKTGVRIVQDPVDNANILDFAAAYEEFPAHYQRIVFPDGGKSMRKVLCAKEFYVRLMQDPKEKYSSRSKGPVNPLTTLPSKSNNKKKFLIPWSDAAIRVGEMEIEMLIMMMNSPEAAADFMAENSTSFEAKLAVSELAYMGDPDEEIDTPDFTVTGKKSIEWIEGLINELGTRVIIEYEES